MEFDSVNTNGGSDLNKFARLNENAKILENQADNDDVNQKFYTYRVVNFFSNFLFLKEFNELLDEEIPAHIKEARLNELKMKAREHQYMQQNNQSIYQ